MRFTTALAIAVIIKGTIYLEEEGGTVRTAAKYEENIFRDITKRGTESSVFVPTPEQVVKRGWRVISGRNPKKIAWLLGRLEDRRENDSPDVQQPNG